MLPPVFVFDEEGKRERKKEREQEERERKRESKREREKEREREKRELTTETTKKVTKLRGNVISFYEQLALPLAHMLDDFSLKMTGRKRLVESWKVDIGRS